MAFALNFKAVPAGSDVLEGGIPLRPLDKPLKPCVWDQYDVATAIYETISVSLAQYRNLVFSGLV